MIDNVTGSKSNALTSVVQVVHGATSDRPREHDALRSSLSKEPRRPLTESHCFCLVLKC